MFETASETLLRQPLAEGTFELGRAGKHMEQAQSPRMLGGDNFIGLPTSTLMKPASAGAMVGITHLLPTCNLLAAEDKDPQVWHTTRRRSNPKRLREAPSTIMIRGPVSARLGEGPLSDSESEVLDPEKCYSALEVQPCGTGLSVYSEPDN